MKFNLQMHYLNLLNEEAMYAYNFEGRRYDVGDKLGFLTGYS